MDKVPSEPHHRARDLVERIQQAFAASEYPGDDHLVYDNSPQHLSCADVKSKLAGLNWNEVPNDLIEDTGQDLLFMTPAARRYFLPTYMIAALTHSDRLWTLLSDLIDILSRLNQFSSTFDQLRASQMAVVADFIRFSIDEFDDDLPACAEATIALHSFWAPRSLHSV